MTQPDLALPGRAWNSTDFGPISTLAATTQGDWEAQLFGEAAAPFDMILDVLFEGLATGLAFPVAFLKMIFEQLLGWIPGSDLVVDILDEVTEWLADPLNPAEIPILGVLFGGDSLFLNSLFGGIDASKIISGTFDWAVSGIQDLVDSIVGGTGNSTSDLNGYFNEIGSDFQDFSDGVLGGSGNPVQNLIDWGTDTLLDIFSPLFGGNLFGLVPSKAVSTIGTGAVAAIPDENFLVNSRFETANSVVPEQNWSWVNIAAHAGVGCAKVVANGTDNAMVSNEVRVTKGETIEVSAWVKWDSLSYTGTDPIALGVTQYQITYVDGKIKRQDVGITSLDTLISPAASGDWTQLTGTYIVPVDVDEVRLTFGVGIGLASGNVYFDDCTLKKTDLIGDHLVPGVPKTVDDTVQALYGWTGSDFQHDDAYQAMVATAAATTANSQQIQWILQQMTTGHTATDDFKRIAATPGGEWSLAEAVGGGGGSLAVDGENLYFSPSGEVARGFHYRFTGTEAASTGDYQKITKVLASAPTALRYHHDGYYSGWWPFQTWHPAVDEFDVGINYVDGRMDGSGANRIEGMVRADGYVAINRIKGGVFTELANTTLSWTPGAGSSLTLMCGDFDSSTPRAFELLINNQTILTATDSTSFYGASYRGWGLGMYAGGSDNYNMQAIPGAVNSWFAQDVA